MTDRELIALFAGHRREEAFGELVRRYGNLVHGAALRQVGEWETAQDGSQAVFIVLWNKGHSIRDGRALAGWLLSVTRLASLEAIKRRAVRRRHEREAGAMNSSQIRTSETRAAQTVDFNALAANLDEALAALSAADRTAVAMRYLAGQSFAEVAGGLGVSEDAAKKRVSRALEKLRLNLANRGLASPADLLEMNLAAISLIPAPAAVIEGIHAACHGGATATVASLTKGVHAMMTASTVKAAAVAMVVVAVMAGGVGIGARILWRGAASAGTPVLMAADVTRDGAGSGAATMPAAVPAVAAAPDVFMPVFIDQKTIDTTGPMPYDRGVYAKPIERAAVLGAKGVVVDMLLYTAGSDKGDQALADAMAKTKVVLPANIDNSQDNHNTLPDRFVVPGVAAGHYAITGQNAFMPLPLFSAAAADVGFVDAPATNDPAFPPMIEEYRGQCVKSLALCALEMGLGVTAQVDAGKQLTLGGKTLALGPLSAASVTFPRQDKIDYVSFCDLLSGRVSPDKLKGRVVLLCVDQGGQTARLPLGRIGSGRTLCYQVYSPYSQLERLQAAAPPKKSNEIYIGGSMIARTGTYSLSHPMDLLEALIAADVDESNAQRTVVSVINRGDPNEQKLQYSLQDPLSGQTVAPPLKPLDMVITSFVPVGTKMDIQATNTRDVSTQRAVAPARRTGNEEVFVGGTRIKRVGAYAIAGARGLKQILNAAGVDQSKVDMTTVTSMRKTDQKRNREPYSLADVLSGATGALVLQDDDVILVGDK